MSEMRAKTYLKKIGLPSDDLSDLQSSSKVFSDGAQYRFEVPGIQGPGTMISLLEEVSHRALVIHRVTQTRGIYMLTDSEIKEMVHVGGENEIELVLAVGPRATTDTSASVLTAEGQRMGYRLRGQDQVVRGIEDVLRAIDLGVKSFLVYDEGLLWVLNQMRNDGEFPKQIKFKVSAHTGHGNACSAKLLESLGANSFNPVRDIQLPMISSIRQAIDIPLDLHTENPKSSGGFIRHYEVPDMIKYGAPLYLKTGGSVAANHSYDTTAAEAKKRAKQVELVQRMIDSYYPDAIASGKGSIG